MHLGVTLVRQLGDIWLFPPDTVKTLTPSLYVAIPQSEVHGPANDLA